MTTILDNALHLVSKGHVSQFIFFLYPKLTGGVMQPIFIGTRSCGQGLLLNKRTCRTCCVVLCRSMQGRKTCARRQNKHAGPRNMCKKTTKTCTRQSSRGGGGIFSSSQNNLGPTLSIFGSLFGLKLLINTITLMSGN